ACLLCPNIQHPKDSKKNGCPNCEEIMQAISVYTTIYFDGITSAIDAESSWVARWRRMGDKIYAVKVGGRVPEDVEAEPEIRGFKY
ncbi:hypothetical protein F5J12DRAFT_723046, partial [Pisolithus orientalis]|uniref:uncharacterized protein n=1 Tax=Pisolithus orientalis TaxID=936130 RepID=UPI0022242738